MPVDRPRSLPRLYAIADGQYQDPVRLGRSLFAGGARLVQIRHKGASSGKLLDQARALVETAPPDGLVIVNDRADVARLARAGGVHLGQGDLPVRHARELLGPDALIGLSTHSLEEAREALEEDVDYIAVGPVFPTRSKASPDPPVGLAGVRTISSLAEVPVVAIGGIRLSEAAEVLRAGAASVAVISDLVGSPDPEARTREFLRALHAVFK